MEVRFLTAMTRGRSSRKKNITSGTQGNSCLDETIETRKTSSVALMVLIKKKKQTMTPSNLSTRGRFWMLACFWHFLTLKYHFPEWFWSFLQYIIYSCQTASGNLPCSLEPVNCNWLVQVLRNSHCLGKNCKVCDTTELRQSSVCFSFFQTIYTFI